MKSYEEIAAEIGRLVQQKNEAYGDSFSRSGEVLAVLYPDGIRPEQYTDALAITRVLDKLFRLANKRDAFNENPWQDIVGYALLGVRNHSSENTTKEQI